MAREVVYVGDFEVDLKRLAAGEDLKQAQKKLALIIERPTTIGRPTANPVNCRHCDICHGRLVIFWTYDKSKDVVTFLRFTTHKKAFR